MAADIPGIIEGAHEGAGLGLRFLRHVERTRVLLHVVDASGISGRDPAEDLGLALEEVRRWDVSMLERPQVVAATKRDLAAGSDDPLPGLRAAAARLGLEVVDGFGGDREGSRRAEATAPPDAVAQPGALEARA